MKHISNVRLFAGMLASVLTHSLLAECPDFPARQESRLYGVGSGNTYEAARENAAAELLIQIYASVESSFSASLSDRRVVTSGSVRSSFNGKVAGLMVTGSCEKSGRHFVEVSLDRHRYAESLEQRILPRYGKLLGKLKAALDGADLHAVLDALHLHRQSRDLVDLLYQCHALDRCGGVAWSRFEELESLISNRLSSVPVKIVVAAPFSDLLPSLRKVITGLGFVEKAGSHRVVTIHCDQTVSDSSTQSMGFVVAEIRCKANLQTEDDSTMHLVQFKGKGIGSVIDEAIASAKGSIAIAD